MCLYIYRPKRYLYLYTVDCNNITNAYPKLRGGADVDLGSVRGQIVDGPTIFMLISYALPLICCKTFMIIESKLFYILTQKACIIIDLLLRITTVLISVLCSYVLKRIYGHSLLGNIWWIGFVFLPLFDYEIRRLWYYKRLKKDKQVVSDDNIR